MGHAIVLALRQKCRAVADDQSYWRRARRAVIAIATIMRIARVVEDADPQCAGDVIGIAREPLRESVAQTRRQEYLCVPQQTAVAGCECVLGAAWAKQRGFESTRD